MTDLLPRHLFADPVRAALDTTHRHLAIGSEAARRYPADVAPFATLAEPSRGSMEALRSLLAPHEAIWLFGADFPAVSGLDFTDRMICPQMALPADAEPRSAGAGTVELTEANAQEMVTLTDLALTSCSLSRDGSGLG
jgi:hypothetical protein